MKQAARSLTLVLGTSLVLTACGGGREDTSSGAGERSDPGITATTIKLGGTFAQSGTLAAAGQAGEGAAAAVAQINAAGGIDGRKIEWVREDDKYDPTLAVTTAKKLIEQQQVFAVSGSVGTPGQLAARSVYAQAKVPALFLYSGAGKWESEFKQYPYTMTGVGIGPSIGQVYGQYLKTEKPNAKVAVLYQNDDSGKDFYEGFKKAIAGSGVKVTADAGYEVTAPTVAPLLASLQQSGADTFFFSGSPQQGSQAVQQIGVLGWKPLILMQSAGFSQDLIKGLGAAGNGVVTESFIKDPNDPEWKNDPDVKAYLEWMAKTSPQTKADSRIPIVGYVHMQLMARALDNMKSPTRQALLESALNLKDVSVPMLLPQVTVTTGPDDPLPFESVQLMQWNGTYLQRLGKPIDISGS
ncbi:MAG: Extracellular ligand-binding receptor [Blastococcus sp.]|jgi:branched-chain amino acid transport system substrate-binding protein|nr:Extracellular ligand-binding receptor [Blastococcus sp.]